MVVENSSQFAHLQTKMAAAAPAKKYPAVSLEIAVWECNITHDVYCMSLDFSTEVHMQQRESC